MERSSILGWPTVIRNCTSLTGPVIPFTSISEYDGARDLICSGTSFVKRFDKICGSCGVSFFFRTSNRIAPIAIAPPMRSIGEDFFFLSFLTPCFSITFFSPLFSRTTAIVFVVLGFTFIFFVEMLYPFFAIVIIYSPFVNFLTFSGVFPMLLLFIETAASEGLEVIFKPPSHSVCTSLNIFMNCGGKISSSIS